LTETTDDSEIQDLIYPRLANVYYRQEFYQEAIRAAQQVVETGGNPEGIAAAIYLMGNAHVKLEQYDQAIAQYEKVIKTYPKSLIVADALFQTGITYNRLGLGGLEKSIEAFTRYSQQYPHGENAPFAVYYLSWGYYRLGEWEKATTSFESFANRFPSHELAPECLYRAGEALFNIKKFEDAMTRFQRVVGRYPKSGYVDAALYSHAWSLINLKREAEAVPLFQRIVAEYPHGKYGAQSQFTLGDYYYSLQQYEKATEEYKRFIQLFPNDRVMVPRAQMLLANLAEIDAYSVYEKGVEFFNQNKYKEALEVFKTVVESYPNSKTAVNAYLNIGATYQALEDFSRARDEYLKFLSRYEKNPDYSTQVEFAKAQLSELKKVL
jgi:TolA-binding protein